MKKRVIIEVISFLFILLFVYAALNKFLDIEKFQIQLGQSPLLTNFSHLVAWGLPTFEITIALLLMIPRYRLIGLYAAFNLMIMFTAYIVAITQFSFYVPCSCGGILQNMGWTEHLLFNISFVILGLVGIVLYEKTDSPAIDNHPSTSHTSVTNLDFTQK